MLTTLHSMLIDKAYGKGGGGSAGTSILGQESQEWTRESLK